MATKLEPHSKIGLIAGNGSLPEHVIDACIKQGREVYVIALENEATAPSITKVPHSVIHVGEVGKSIKTLKSQDIHQIVLAGGLKRVQLSSLKLDYSGMKLVARIARARFRGDNVVFNAIIDHLENAGFEIVGCDQLLDGLLAPKGIMTKKKPDGQAKDDIESGKKIVKRLGEVDIGQAVVVQQGFVLGVEAIEGTDALLSRCKGLKREGPGGVLVKMQKPNQDKRIDLPTIGVQTVENAYKAGLRGIAIEAGGAIIVNRDEAIKHANSLGFFLIGI